MTVDANEFFEGKRPWSRIKDRILGQYMSPYVAKVATRPERVLLIDAFAGPGTFEADSSPGSPLIICKAANEYAKEKYKALFVNEKEEHHIRLANVLEKAKWTPNAQAIHGDAQDLLNAVSRILTNQSVFIYLDPFGLKDCAFDTLKPFLNRDRRYSTEIIINLNMTGVHRLAAREKFKAEGATPQVQQWHEILTSTFGGNEWRNILLTDDDNTPKEKERAMVELYKSKLAATGYLIHHGDCPVMDGNRTKYHMVFASSHPDAKKLLNDMMCKAFNEAKHSEEVEGTLFEGVHWTAWHDTSALPGIVFDQVRQNPGKTRGEIWMLIVHAHFMRFTHSQYLEAVKQAVKKEHLKVQYTPTGRLNDDCRLFLP